MSKSQENISAEFRYSSVDTALNLQEIIDIFGSEGDKVHTDRNSQKDVLWEGFFGMFEGPAIVRAHTKTKSVSAGSVEAKVQKSRRSIAGIPIEGRSKSTQLSSGRQGKTLTALSAYATMLTPGNDSNKIPRIELPGVRPIPGERSSDGLIHRPFGIANVAIDPRPRREHNRVLNPHSDNTLFSIGELSIIGEKDISLPHVMVGQTAVLGEIIGDPLQAEQVIESVYGGNVAAVHEAWGQATAMKTPRQAAEHILTTLSS